MRVKIQSLETSNKIVFLNNCRYWAGEIICMKDDLATDFIKDKIVEPYNYSIPDDEIRKLYKEFIEASEFKIKVDFYKDAISKSLSEVLLEDNTTIKFILIPKTTNEWLLFNKELMEYYKIKSPEHSIEGLKNDFKRKNENFKHSSTLIQKELRNIEKVLALDHPNGIRYWYEMAISGEVPSKGGEYQDFLSKEIPYGLDVYLQGIAIAEYKEFLKNLTSKIIKDSDKPTQRQIALMYRYLFISQPASTYKPHNWHEIAKENGFISPTSGNKIYQHFNMFSSKPDRINYKGSFIDISKVIEMLSIYPEARAIAEKELKEIPSK